MLPHKHALAVGRQSLHSNTQAQVQQRTTCRACLTPFALCHAHLVVAPMTSTCPLVTQLINQQAHISSSPQSLCTTHLLVAPMTSTWPLSLSPSIRASSTLTILANIWSEPPDLHRGSSTHGHIRPMPECSNGVERVVISNVLWYAMVCHSVP